MKKIISLFFVIILLFACRSVPFTGRKQFSLMPDQTVLSLSLQQYNEFIHQAKLSNNAQQKAMVIKVGQKIANAVGSYYRSHGMSAQLKNFSWEFNLVETNQINAFCMPGGKIVVYTGILPITQNETGLAVVLGHEVAHALAKHANERLSQQLAVTLGGIGLDLALSKKSNEVRQISQGVFGLGAQLGVLLPFSRQHELEADKIGLILMAMAGYNPREAPAFWQRMAQKGTSTPEFLSTHPSDSKRIQQIQSYLPEALKYYKPQ
jgi:predicted Zn-dependent protease